MQIYLHIGLHKTATTFLQNRVFPRAGVTYVRAGGALVRDLTWQQPYAFDADRTRRDLLADVPESADKVLISSEDFSGTPLLGYVNRPLGLERLHAMFPEAKVLVGIRGQRSMIWSLYKHYVSHGGTRSLQAAIDRSGHPGAGWIDLDGFRYGPYLDSIAQLFGHDAVKPLLYEHLAEDQDGFIADVAAFLGGSVEGPVAADAVNRSSLTDRNVWARRTLNRVLLNRGHAQGVIPVPRSVQRGILAALATVGRGCPDRATLAELDGRYRDDNLSLAERYGLDLTATPRLAASWFPEGHPSAG